MNTLKNYLWSALYLVVLFVALKFVVPLIYQIPWPLSPLRPDPVEQRMLDQQDAQRRANDDYRVVLPQQLR